MGYLFASLAIVAYLLIVVFMIRLVLDWVQMLARYWRPKGLMLVVASFVYAVTDPPMNAARRLIKPINLGGISLDLGFMILLMALWFAYSLLTNLAYNLSV
ncbi:YggT family protein [Rothia nasimurium]|uniref:YggT family protein n=1 Tax=Rothia nasimurium TaxID=85336 RepID=UPI00235136EF|nr:YggT family protein [Rothia nasimurium]